MIRDQFKLYVTERWSGINRRTVNGSHRAQILTNRNQEYFRKGIAVMCTRVQFAAWCKQQWPLIQKMRSEGKRPSIDRIDNDGHYTPANLRIVDKSINCKQAGETLRKKFAAKIASLPERFCMHCGKVLVRKVYRKRVDRKGSLVREGSSFASRKYCGRSCAAKEARNIYMGKL